MPASLFERVVEFGNHRGVGQQRDAARLARRPGDEPALFEPDQH